ncbi:MAG TPA: HlyD family efflux transporter periplasmic adaptor subunit [Nostoc sp.]|uniref:HlyD family efflux transporter periplasmic adaptor subunit n=1 Tax=Nostoc sp. TaxID=1180 RepID=UPI002D37130F|nr:HlyD family efflux transporter periplasmic adaptor subunit [Nostoc sp.]HYX14229.1 HlyD family efflux transporter periplasmic adaptor subunit [Nostoc sp.]
MLSKVDETGSARGRLEPQGRTLRLDAPVTGKVISIKVKEGETVKAGQTLLELESDINRTELQQTQAKLEGQQNRVNQLQLLKNQLTMSLRTQQLQNQAQESEQLAQLDQIQQRLNSSKQVYILEKGRLKLANNEIQRYRYLWQKGAISKSKLEEIEGAMFERQRLREQATTEITKQQSTNQRISRTGELALLDSQRQIKELQSQIVDVLSEIDQTKKQIQSLQFQLQQQTLRAPIDGTIFQLSINNAGAVVQPGQMVTQIAPQGAPLIFRAEMPSQESGFLRVGMPVKLKFDAYPFQDYGVTEGKLRSISPDSKVVETAQGKIENFELEIAMPQTYIQNGNKRIALTPGQTATAEVIVRQRRIIDFVLDPFKKLQKGGLEL